MYDYADYYQHYGKTMSTTSRDLMFLCLEWNSGAVHLNVTSEPRAVSPAPNDQSEHLGACLCLEPSNHHKSFQHDLPGHAAARVPMRVHCCSLGTQRKCLENKYRTKQRRQPKADEVTSVLWRLLRASVSGILLLLCLRGASKVSCFSPCCCFSVPLRELAVAC